MKNKDIAQHFKVLGKLLELHGENPFKTRSYSNAAFQITRIEKQLSEMPLEEIGAMKGFGKAITEKIGEMLETGELPQLNKIAEATPAGLLAMINVKGIGAKKLGKLWKELGIESAGELLYACNENHLTLLKGFGEKTQENIKQALEYFFQNESKFHYASLAPFACELVEFFEQAGVSKIEFTGALRRKLDVLEAIELIALVDEKDIILSTLKKLKFEVEDKGEMISAKSEHDLKTIIYLTKKEEFIIFQFYKTAGINHLEQLGELNFKGKSFNSEEDIYASLKMKYIEPELREGFNEIELAKKDALPKLITKEDIKGVVHNHSTYSDGRNSLKEMAEACQNAGYEYFVISDHSKSAFYAGGLTEAEIEAQHKEIDELNKSMAPFKIFKSIESDILNDGSLDYEEGVLKTFDLVIASIHSNLKMDEAKAMKRIITAIENPYTNILGHMTGRLLLAREGYPLDHHKVIDACVANKVVIELNASPHRLDIDWRLIPYALEKGAMISINPDAHSVEGIHDIYYGVCAARKGHVTAAETLNAAGADEFLRLINKK